MIIPDYNNGTVNVHLELSDKDKSLSNTDIAKKAFMIMTGLELENGYFITESLRISIIFAEDECAICSQGEESRDVDLLTTLLVKDAISNNIIITFHKAIFQTAEEQSDDFDISIIDFLFKYKNELFTTKSDIII